MDVLACPKCHGRMRLLAMVQEPANVARFLAAMGEPTELPCRSPGRGPPYWKSRVLVERERAVLETGGEVLAANELEDAERLAARLGIRSSGASFRRF